MFLGKVSTHTSNMRKWRNVDLDDWQWLKYSDTDFLLSEFIDNDWITVIMMIFFLGGGGVALCIWNKMHNLYSHIVNWFSLVWLYDKTADLCKYNDRYIYIM